MKKICSIVLVSFILSVTAAEQEKQIGVAKDGARLEQTILNALNDEHIPSEGKLAILQKVLPGYFAAMNEERKIHKGRVAILKEEQKQEQQRAALMHKKELAEQGVQHTKEMGIILAKNVAAKLKIVELKERIEEYAGQLAG